MAIREKKENEETVVWTRERRGGFRMLVKGWRRRRRRWRWRWRWRWRRRRRKNKEGER